MDVEMAVMNKDPVSEVEEWKEHIKEEMKVKDAKSPFDTRHVCKKSFMSLDL